MTEALIPLTLEEQVKQDPRFSYLLELKPEFAGTLVELIKPHMENPAKHSSFWLLFLDLYNFYVNAIRTKLSAPEEDMTEDEWETHRESVRKFLTEDISESTTISKVPGFFDDKEGILDPSREGVFTSPSNYSKAINEIDKQQILDYDYLFLEMPRVFKDFTNATR